MDEIKINENERKVLNYLVPMTDSEVQYQYFRHIAESTGLDLKQVSRACRSLKKKGLAEFMRGLFDDDGKAAGSGYGATEAGVRLIENQQSK